MNWEPGDRAIVYRAAPEQKRLIGEIVCIASVPYYSFKWMTTYVNIEPLDGHSSADIRCLRPIDDGNEPATWEDMEDIWVPKELIRV